MFICVIVTHHLTLQLEDRKLERPVECSSVHHWGGASGQLHEISCSILFLLLHLITFVYAS